MVLPTVNKKSRCLECVFFLPDIEGQVGCAAFLHNIPKKYLEGSAVHTRPDPGQIGDAVFTPKPLYKTR